MATPELFRVGQTGGAGEGVGAGETTEGTLPSAGDAAGAVQEAAASLTGESDPTKMLKPLPHAVADYALAATMIASPWLFGFSRNRKAKANAVATGLGVLGLSLMTKYPLGVVKMIPFPVHGKIEAAAGALTATAPWLMGFSRNGRAKWTHLLSGLGTLAVYAVTDYQAAERDDDAWAVNTPEPTEG